MPDWPSISLALRVAMVGFVLVAGAPRKAAELAIAADIGGASTGGEVGSMLLSVQNPIILELFAKELL